MKWKIKYIFNFTDDKTWKDGYAQFGFHDYKGNFYIMRNEANWLGQLTKSDEFLWTAGSVNPKLSRNHIDFDLKSPMYLARDPTDASLLISSGGNKKVFKLVPEEKKATLFIDANAFGLQNIGNCVPDQEGNVWVNEITGCRLWQFDSEGNKRLVLGNGKPGFQLKPTDFEKVQFNWIYDIRLGLDNNLYILDSRNYAVRMIDYDQDNVQLIAGTGKPGYYGDGGLAINAKFGSDPTEQFDGPWALSLDEEGNIFIGDTHNHVVRMIEAYSNIISTIAGNRDIKPHGRNSTNQTNPFKINLPKICSMDYYNRQLFIPEWDGDLIVIEKSN